MIKKGELKEDMMDEWVDGGCHSREKRETKDMEQWRKILKVRKTKMRQGKKIMFWSSDTNNN